MPLAQPAGFCGCSGTTKTAEIGWEERAASTGGVNGQRQRAALQHTYCAAATAVSAADARGSATTVQKCRALQCGVGMWVAAGWKTRLFPRRRRTQTRRTRRTGPGRRQSEAILGQRSRCSQTPTRTHAVGCKHDAVDIGQPTQALEERSVSPAPGRSETLSGGSRPRLAEVGAGAGLERLGSSVFAHADSTSQMVQ